MKTKSNPHGIKVGQTVYLKFYNASVKEATVLKVGRKYFITSYNEDMKINLSNLIMSDWPHYLYWRIYLTKEDADLEEEKQQLRSSIHLFFGTTKAKSLSIDVLREIKKLAGI